MSARTTPLNCLARQRARSPETQRASGVSAGDTKACLLLLPEVVERLEQLHGRLVVQSVAFVPYLVEALQVGGQCRPALHKEDKLSSVESHGGSDLDEHVLIDEDVLLAHLVEDLDLLPHMNDCRGARPHVIH